MKSYGKCKICEKSETLIEVSRRWPGLGGRCRTCTAKLASDRRVRVATWTALVLGAIGVWSIVYLCIFGG